MAVLSGGYPLAANDATRHGHAPRSKPYEELRPGDFVSFKATSAREGCLRLIIGRLCTADGHDVQDDFTLTVEKNLMGRPLETILREVYCPARGIPTDAEQTKVTVKFMLPEAGAGLGWLDTSLSPWDLKLKDSDIVEVLVTERRASGSQGDLEAMDEPVLSRQEALDFFTQELSKSAPEAWLPKVWQALLKYVEDDNVVLPGLKLLASFVVSRPSHRKTAVTVVGPGCDALGLLLRALGDLHSGNKAVQEAGWSLLAELAKEPSLRPHLTRRAKSLALRLREELTGGAKISALQMLDSLGYQPPKETSTSRPEAVQTKVLQLREDPVARCRREAAEAAVKLEQAVNRADPMDIEKALLNLISKIRKQQVDWKTLQEAGIGRLLGVLRDFEGDADIRSLANKAVIEVAKLQHADYIR
mmetsp:Transcript_71845/g.126914  ORF Transcript_71845/g.126914 Transcript_71845/m.126914 type:complete len:417 (-) Transcript_71845:178-1428(-)|eukprot:CAMPEP_0197630852 /NCGR_PEP_ID=MMETSP1338-20131121/8207_1 /TAXON_ID=43686 ORGANISM="Pelagodinium beii, Strain RCC1491" /NCGR_SAMPLE_ID=MMETSP1338 /ASSEMBLY_ACC=CAM_ASM_000754 /LENGTH=416 /DNA_ID=CAMNT_0043202167 /DNA_START=57 /DNA_END=1307 /DNA_ORIENTATION=+